MGVMRFFTAPLADDSDHPAPEATYFVSYDGRIIRTRAERVPGELHCVRPVSDSGKLKTTWPAGGGEVRMLSTTSLREKEEPYSLAVELARGTLGELRNQAAIWEQGGMSIPLAYREAEREAFRLFSQAACRQTVDAAEAAELAQRSLELACRADDELLRGYTFQKLATHQRTGQLPVVLGCGVSAVPDEESSERFTDAFTAAAVPMRWSDIELSVGQYDWSGPDALVAWAKGRNLLLRGGPLLDFRPGGLPGWLEQWAHDLPSLQSFLCDFVETAVARYRGAVKFWEVAAGGADGGVFGIGEEERLTLTARVVEAARRADDDSHVVVRVNDPWGGYQNRGDYRLTPLQFVDALARSGLGLGVIGLEIDLNTVEAARPLSEVSRLIDLWSIHGLPLQVTVRASVGENALPESVAQRWAADFLPLLMAKPTVTAVYWSQYADGPAADPPGGGVVGEDGRPKGLYETFVRHRRAQG